MKNINKIAVLICLSAGLAGCNQQADKPAKDTSSIKTTKVQKSHQNHKPQAKEKNVAKTAQQQPQTEAQPKVSDTAAEQTNNQNRQQDQNRQQNQTEAANQALTKSEQVQTTANNSVTKQAPTSAVINDASQAAGVLANYFGNKYGNGATYVPVGSQIYNGQKAYIINLYLPNDIHPAAAYFVLSNGTIIRKW